MWTPHSNLVFIITLTASFRSAMPSSDMKYVGCYDPSYAITRNYHTHMAQFTLSRCLTLCRGLRSRYMGADVSDDFCYCGDDIPQGSVSRPDVQCNSPCPGDVESTNDTCGGEWLISVYDLEPATSPGLSNVTDARNVSFLIGTSVGMRLYSVATPGSFATITNSTAWANNVDYHLRRNRAYFHSGGQLYRTTLDPKAEPGSATPFPVIVISNGCEGFAVDWVHDSIYWVDCSTNSLKVSDLDGWGTTTLVKLRGDGRSVERMEVDPMAGRLFWVADGTVEWSDLAGGDFRTNLSVPGVYVRTLALDITARRLYYVGAANESTCLYELSYGQDTILGTVKYPSQPDLRSVYGMGVIDGILYWVNYANVRDVMYRQPLNMTGQPEMVRPIDKMVWHMRVVDPDLQKPSSGDPCHSLSCQHVCVRQGGVARCLCPDGKRLQPTDNTTCTDIDQSFRYAGCFSTDFTSQLRLAWRMPNRTLGACLNRCRGNHTRFAGIGINEGYCYCGDDLTEVSSLLNATLCHLPCPGLPGYSCGGDWLMSVYELANSTTIDDEFGLRFLFGATNTVMMYDPESPKSELSTIMLVGGSANNVNYHIRRDLAFTSANGILLRSPLLPKFDTPSPHVRVPLSTCHGFTVDWEADVIYTSDCNNNSILSATLKGENVTTLLHRPEELAIIRNMEVDPYYRMLIWTADGVLESCDLSGQNFRTNLSDPEYNVRTTALHLTTRTIYYISMGHESADLGLFSLRYDQLGVSPHLVVGLDQMRSVYGLGIFRDHIYWMNYAANRDVLYKAPLNVSSTDDVVVVKVLEKVAWHMRLVHPELQSRPPSLEPTQDMTIAQHSALPLWTVVFGLLSVGLILVLAVVLLYLTDTRWSRLQGLFSRAPAYRQDIQDQEEQEPPAHISIDDRVLLI